MYYLGIMYRESWLADNR